MFNEAIHKHHRRSIRLKEYDYASEGGYFVTLVTYKRQRLFGEVVDGMMRLTVFGRIAREEWFETQRLRPNVELLEDEFVVMPNHIHGIIWLHEDENELKDGYGTGTMRNPSLVRAYRDTPLRSPSNTLGAIIRGYKGAVTTRINSLRHVKGEPVWLRNYYEHIIINEKEYENIANYINNNPFNWGSKDEYYQS